MLKIKNLIKTLLCKKQKKIVVQVNVVQLTPNDLLKNRSALITGGSSGIGFAIAEAYLKAGAKVVITSRSETKLNDAISKLSAFGECSGVVLDVTNVDILETQFKSALSKYGRIDILVNNAGVSGARIGSATEEEWDNVLNTNLKGVFFLSQIAGKYMKDNQIHGNILNISSASSLRPAACAYTISKWGIRGFTMGLARTLLPYDIVVNALAPGPTATPLLKKETTEDIALPNTPSSRYALPMEIANMAVVLVSDMSRLIVGDTVFMTGGAGNINNGDIDYDF